MYEGNLQVPPEIMQKFRCRTQIQVPATPSDVMEITEDTEDTENVGSTSEDRSSLYFTGVPACISTVTGVPTSIATVTGVPTVTGLPTIIKPKVETYIPTEEE